jgi:SAM-dependent methyltransferase
LTPELDLERFDPNFVVLDIGCGSGRQLDRMRAAGLRALGVERSPQAARECHHAGHRVIIARAEELPVRTGACGGVICKVVLPYTEERRVVQEIGRILNPGGIAVLVMHGLGYSLLYLFRPVGWRHAVYALRTIVNTLVYRLSGHRLPGFIGDTIYQSTSRMRRYYRKSGLSVVAETMTRPFARHPVFFEHVVQRQSTRVEG